MYSYSCKITDHVFSPPDNTPDEDNVWKLRRRFLKDRSTASKYFARREIKEKSKREVSTIK